MYSKIHPLTTVRRLIMLVIETKWVANCLHNIGCPFSNGTSITWLSFRGRKKHPCSTNPRRSMFRNQAWVGGLVSVVFVFAGLHKLNPSKSTCQHLNTAGLPAVDDFFEVRLAQSIPPRFRRCFFKLFSFRKVDAWKMICRIDVLNGWKTRGF